MSDNLEGYSPCCSSSYRKLSSIIASCDSCDRPFIFKSFVVSGDGLFGKKSFKAQIDHSQVNKSGSKIRQFKRRGRS